RCAGCVAILVFSAEEPAEPTRRRLTGKFELSEECRHEGVDLRFPIGAVSAAQAQRCSVGRIGLGLELGKASLRRVWTAFELSPPLRFAAGLRLSSLGGFVLAGPTARE